MRADQAILLAVERILRGLRRRLRAAYYSRVLKSMGKGCMISDGVLVTQPHNVSLGDRVAINEGVLLQSCESAGITIGDSVVLSFGAMLLTGGLELSSNGPNYHRHSAMPIAIQHSAWIGARAIILPGVTVGHGAVVATGSVVTGDVEPHTVVAGAPARVIRVL